MIAVFSFVHRGWGEPLHMDMDMVVVRKVLGMGKHSFCDDVKLGGFGYWPHGVVLALHFHDAVMRHGLERA